MDPTQAEALIYGAIVDDCAALAGNRFAGHELAQKLSRKAAEAVLAGAGTAPAGKPKPAAEPRIAAKQPDTEAKPWSVRRSARQDTAPAAPAASAGPDLRAAILNDIKKR